MSPIDPLPVETDCASVKHAQDQASCLLLDCREQDEYDVARIEGATLLPMSEIQNRLAELEPVGGNARVVAGTVPGGTGADPSPLLVLGDAAGTIAPLCGDGQAMALRAAALLADFILATPAQLDTSAHARLRDDWSRRWRREFRTRLRVGHALQWLLLGKRTQRWTVAALARLPVITRALVRATRGEIR